jgi:hypothetical protein
MRDLILERIANHWDESLEEIFDMRVTDVYNLSDEELFNLYNTIFELGI